MRSASRFSVTGIDEKSAERGTGVFAEVGVAANVIGMKAKVHAMANRNVLQRTGVLVCG
jgi:hypothetical protein